MPSLKSSILVRRAIAIGSLVSLVVPVASVPSQASVPPTPVVAPDPIRDATVVTWPGPGQVALTFDDGPHPTTTPLVLDILDREMVPGTFFLVCRLIPRSPDVMTRMSSAGHSVQNHTMNHPYLVRLKSDKATAELSSCSNAIESVTGRRPTAYRPPYGSHNERIDGIASSLGMHKVMWNSTIPITETNAKAIVKQITGQIRRAEGDGRGLVILLHDGSGARSAQVAALGPIIQRLKSGGWQFVKIG